MEVSVSGRNLWYDEDRVEKDKDLTPLILLHGGPGSFDHSYFRPDFSRLSGLARVIYLDLPDHGRSDWGAPEDWSFAAAGDLIRGFCESLGLGNPVVLGHSFGGLVAIEYAARHPDHASGLILQSTFARFDLDRVVEGFRAIAGNEVARIVRRSYEGDESVTAEEWERCWALFGPWVPSAEDRARIPRNQGLNDIGGRLMLEVDMIARLAAIMCPTLVSVGRLDPITPVWAAEIILDGLMSAPASIQLLDDAGHFPWRDSPKQYWPSLVQFLHRVSVARETDVPDE